MLLVAIGAHVWLVQPRRADGVAARLPAAVSKSGLTIAPSVAARQAHSPSGRSVRVRAEFIDVPVAFEPDEGRPRRLTPDRPVATGGFVLASLEASPESANREATSASTDSVLPPVPAQTAVGPRPEAIETPEYAPEEVRALVSAAPTEVNTLAPATPAIDSAAELRKQEEIVRRVLLDYARAYERLDVKAAKAIRPSINDRELARAFQQIEEQQVHFSSCGVSITDRDANARCRGKASFRPKVGSRVMRVPKGEWTFSLARHNDRWQIVDATLQ
jgi:hypothetical protein